VQYAGIEKDSAGKPLLVGCPYYISLSHTEGYAAAILHPRFSSGQSTLSCSGEVTKVAPRVLRRLSGYAHNNLSKTAVYWCAKEARFLDGRRAGTHPCATSRLHDFRGGEWGRSLGNLNRKTAPSNWRNFYRQNAYFYDGLL
jgi:hypothetical protein